MAEPIKSLPKPMFRQQYRPPQKNIPQNKAGRESLWKEAQEYVKKNRAIFPISFGELKEHADIVIEEKKIEAVYRDYLAVLINNAACTEILASIPFQRRLLLLPKCLRKEDTCKAPFDEFGLLCRNCGMCSIQDLQLEAEKLGYAVLVAEGSPIVMSIIETGKIEAIVGVSCLCVLERVFPYMEAAAVPGVAIPLLQDDCLNTTVDLDWVWDVIHLTSEDKTYRLNLDGLREEIQTWFSCESLKNIMGDVKNETAEIAHSWLNKSGKRWRPFLTICCHQALKDNPKEISIDLKKLAVAVECFHKASLIHDDIEDEDAMRYGEKTLHQEYGVPIALNVGDYLVSEGYRLILECDADPECKMEMLRLATAGYRDLCIGQGSELCWAKNPEPMAPVKVVDIFDKKTAPAFEIALRIGAAYAEATAEIHDVLAKYSQSLGIAYQIQDDIDDFQESDMKAMRPSLLLAITYEKAVKTDKEFLRKLWRKEISPADYESEIARIVEKTKVEKRTLQLLESYKEEATRSLRALDNPTLKGLLRRVVGKIFNDLEIKGWCGEFETTDSTNNEEITTSVKLQS